MSEPTVVEDIYHAKLGWSGAAGWMRCSQWQGGGGSSIHSATGTAMHELGAQLLKDGGDAKDHVGRVYSIDGFTITIDIDLATAVQKYVDEVRAIHASMGGTLIVEQSYPIDHITGEPNAISTTDCGIVPAPGKTEALIGDLKGGMGVPVEAEGNEQLQGYAISMIDEVGLVADIKTVRMMIFQPRLNSTTEWVQTVEQLEEFRARAMAAAKAHGTGEPTPGEKQCRWCTKAATCPALSKQVFEAVDEVDPEEVSTDELADSMARADMIEAWLKAIRAETERRLLDGRTVRGFKLVQGKKGNRKWSNEAEAEAALKAMRIKHDQMYSYSVISPTTAEKLVKADVIGERQWVKLQSLITQSEGSLSVAPESDKRPAVTPAAQEFQPIETGVPG